MFSNKLFFTAAVSIAALAFGSVESARAAVLVHVVQNDPSSGDASVVPSSALPSANFNSPDINFNVGDSLGQSLNAFLNNPTFVNISNGFDPTQSANNTFLEITAQTFLTAGLNSFVVGHDDGVVLTFSDPSIGIVVNAPGPTSFSNTPFNVTASHAANYGFDLKYTECCGGPANLVFNINGAPIGNTIPEPATLLLSGLSLAAIGLYSRFRLSRVK